MTNVLSPAPSPVQLRAMLEAMVVGDLLGPAAGPEEELTERNVRDRYLVGVLAPRPQPQPTPAKVEEEDDEETPLLPDELSEGGADTVDDGTTDKDVPIVQAHLPSSFGLTFCVDKSAKSLKVEARWGQYKREIKEDQIDERTGRPKRVWKRYQRSGVITLKLDKATLKPTSVNDDFPNIYVRGQVRKRDHGIIVTLFLVNGQEKGRPKDEYHLFQPELIVTDPDGAAIFCRRMTRKPSAKADPGTKLEDDAMAMLYRRHAEFAVGHGVSVHAESSPDAPDRGVLVKTTFIPRYEVPRTTPPTAADVAVNPALSKLAGLVLDMKELADLQAKQVKAKLGPLVTAYREWIDGQEALLKKNQKAFEDFADAPAEAIKKCRQNLVRIEAGLKLLEEDDQAGEAFRFMNQAMWLQRTHSLYSEQVRRGGQPDFDKDIDVPANRTWYPFQVAFILLNLPGLTKLDHPDRSEEQSATADLLFFPTGGGKTEAYLGLTAYTMGLRRLQGVVAGRSGENGVAVLMRYTLRLLTIQQFQRATALICACESIRRKALEKSDKRWGETPFRIGLWVGRRTTPNKTDDDAEAIKQLRGNHFGGAGIGSPYQLTTCPWCGVPKERLALRDRAVALLAKISGQERIWLHWGMTALAYPFFRDSAEVVGRLLALQDDFTTAQVQGRLLTAWGDRATSKVAAQKLLTTLADWEVLRATKTKGQFLLARKMTTGASELQLWLLEALLGASAAGKIEAQQLLRMPESFPFTLSVGVADLRKHEGFDIHRQGLDMDMVALRKVRVEQPEKPGKRKARPKKAGAGQPDLFDRQPAEVFSDNGQHWTLADVPFAAPITECAGLIRDGHFYAGVALAQAVIESAVLLVWRVKVRKRKNQSAEFVKALEALRSNSLIDDTCKSTVEGLWADRDSILLHRPGVDSETQLLEEAARSSLTLAEGIAREFFGYSQRDDVVVPDHPEYWSAVEEVKPVLAGD
jgi:hypothetical protein